MHAERNTSVSSLHCKDPTCSQAATNFQAPIKPLRRDARREKYVCLFSALQRSNLLAGCDELPGTNKTAETRCTQRKIRLSLLCVHRVSAVYRAFWLCGAECIASLRFNGRSSFGPQRSGFG